MGMDVVFWGARSAGYQRGRIVAPRSEERLPHPGYGLQKFELQLAMQIDPTDLPDVGDSGGPILTVSGELVGFLAGGPLACRITPPGKCIAYGVPAASALEGLGLAAIVMEKEDPDENR
ncbi:MAG: hypothetical protein O7H41_00755 [Planctomycetota bacterium]|nr:hypothetical protein [Planctomycetota bacterium]